MNKGFLVLDSGIYYEGDFLGGEHRAGEVVFNTSHSGYEEMASDPSYYSQILVTTAPQQGNYGAFKEYLESRQYWIEGFICLEIQNSKREKRWLDQLLESKIPILTGLDTRKLTLRLRQMGTEWGAIVSSQNLDIALKEARRLIDIKKLESQDWVSKVSVKERADQRGLNPHGPRIALIDFGCKSNILRIIKRHSSEVAVFPCSSSLKEIQEWNPSGIVLSNGPGDPACVDAKVLSLVKNLIGWKAVYGICMGHQILSLVLGAKTFRLKFGHRGGNHPVKDWINGEIYVTSQNHGYAVEPESLPSDVKITHTNLNDNTVEGIENSKFKCWGVQFHPESHPGPQDAEKIFEYFLNNI